MTAVNIAVKDLSSAGVLESGELQSIVNGIGKHLTTHYNDSPWVEHGYCEPFAEFIIIDPTANPPEGYWLAEILDDDPNQPGALAYHEDQVFDNTIEGKAPAAFAAEHGIEESEIHSAQPRKATSHTARGLAKHPDHGGLIPVLKVLAKTTKDDGASVSEAFDHEALEALVDPYVTKEEEIRRYLDPELKEWYIGEVCDAVQSRGVEIDGVLCSDFVYPSFFEQEQTRPQTTAGEEYGYAPAIKPFEISPQGYMSIAPEDEPDNWSQIYGSNFQHAPAPPADVAVSDQKVGTKSDANPSGNVDVEDDRAKEFEDLSDEKLREIAADPGCDLDLRLATGELDFRAESNEPERETVTIPIDNTGEGWATIPGEPSTISVVEKPAVGNVILQPVNDQPGETCITVTQAPPNVPVVVVVAIA